MATLFACITRITTGFSYYRCSVSSSLELSECSFLQTHPIAHGGLRTDFKNDTIPDNLTVTCNTLYELGKKNKRVEIKFNSVLVGSAYKMFNEISIPNSVCTFSKS